MDQFDVVVIGAGAAGMMCAAEAGQARAVRADRRPCGQARREDPHLRRRALQLHQPQRRAGELHLAESRASPSRPCAATRKPTSSRSWSATASPITRRPWASSSATARRRQIVDLLLSEMRQANVELRLATSVQSVEKMSDGFALTLSQGAVQCRSLVVAIGRQVDPEDGRHRLRLRSRAAIRA